MSLDLQKPSLSTFGDKHRGLKHAATGSSGLCGGQFRQGRPVDTGICRMLLTTVRKRASIERI